MIYYIYKITNNVNELVYIGYTKNIEKRIRQHKTSVRLGSTYKIHEAIRTIGIDNFTFEEICSCNDKEYTLRFLEPFFVEQYNSFHNGYNATRGGAGTKEITRQPLSETQRKNISEATKRGMESIEVRKRVSKGLKRAYQNNPLLSERNRNKSLGVKHSDETKRKMSRSNHASKEHMKNLHKKRDMVKVKQQLRELSWSMRKTYIVFDPNKNEYTTNNLKQLCKDKELTYSIMIGVANGRFNHHKQWQCKKVV